MFFVLKLKAVNSILESATTELNSFYHKPKHIYIYLLSIALIGWIHVLTVKQQHRIID
jgi:hypothetical protein